MRIRTALVLLVLLSVPILVQAQAPVRVPFQEIPSFLGYVEDEFIIVLERGARANVAIERDAAGKVRVNLPSLQQTIENQSVTRLVREFPTAKPRAEGSRFPDMTGHYVVTLPPGADLDRAIEAFKNDPAVESVEKIGIHTMYATPNDTYYDDPPPTFLHDQWHYWRDHGIDADLAWDLTTGDPDVVVGILDSGVRYFHTDLGGPSAQWGPAAPYAGGNIWINPLETPNNSTDDDGNGLVDDTIGWDFVESATATGTTCIDGDCGTVDNDPDDFNGHGTHVAGTVAAITNNARSVAGIAGGFSNGTTSGLGNGAKILPCRIGWHASYQGQPVGIVRMDYAAQAMNYIADLVDAGVNVAAINCSWGSSNTGGIATAVSNLVAHDVMVVTAAGNSNVSTAPYLGTRSDVMSVAATDSTGAGASFTNYGTWVDVAAPGVYIMSTYRSPSDPNPANHYVAMMDGTSMAAPHVCGIAALLESCDPDLTRTQKTVLIQGNTTPYTGTKDLGDGIANAYLALVAAGCTGPCDIVADFSGTPLSGEAPLEVQFTDASTGAETWAWYFGDDSTSTLQNPAHTYENAGTYTVTLIVTSTCGADTLTMTDYVDAQPCGIAADFSADPLSGEAPLEVQFTDASTGAETWAWAFGDDSTSTLQNPLHTYENPGTYTVTLVVTRACGADTLTMTDYIDVTEPCVIAADFTADPTEGEAPLEVQFTDASTGAETWAWYFGDDSTSTLQNPMHTYENPDTYTVTLIVTGTCGADTLTMTDYIGVTPHVTAIGDPPAVTGTATWAYPNPFNPGTTVYFQLERPGQVRIIVYDAAGRAVRTLVEGSYPAGPHRADFDARDNGGRPLASGVYFYRFEAPGSSITKKIVLLK